MLHIILLERNGVFFATVLLIVSTPLAANQTRVLNLTIRQRQQQHSVGILRMTTREKLNLAGLALGVTATFVWIGLLGIALSRAVEWLL